MNRRPLCVADGGEHLATCVQSLIEHAVVSGFKDGSVRLAELDEQKNAILLRGATGIEVTALAVTESGSHILIGDQEGNIFYGHHFTNKTKK